MPEGSEADEGERGEGGGTDAGCASRRSNHLPPWVEDEAGRGGDPEGGPQDVDSDAAEDEEGRDNAEDGDEEEGLLDLDGDELLVRAIEAEDFDEEEQYHLG